MDAAGAGGRDDACGAAWTGTGAGATGWIGRSMTLSVGGAGCRSTRRTGGFGFGLGCSRGSGGGGGGTGSSTSAATGGVAGRSSGGSSGWSVCGAGGSGAGGSGVGAGGGDGAAVGGGGAAGTGGTMVAGWLGGRSGARSSITASGAAGGPIGAMDCVSNNQAAAPWRARTTASAPVQRKAAGTGAAVVAGISGPLGSRRCRPGRSSGNRQRGAGSAPP